LYAKAISSALFIFDVILTPANTTVKFIRLIIFKTEIKIIIIYFFRI
jgi:hypothetical protein